MVQDYEHNVYIISSAEVNITRGESTAFVDLPGLLQDSEFSLCFLSATGFETFAKLFLNKTRHHVSILVFHALTSLFS